MCWSSLETCVCSLTTSSRPRSRTWPPSIALPLRALLDEPDAFVRTATDPIASSRALAHESDYHAEERRVRDGVTDESEPLKILVDRVSTHERAAGDGTGWRRGVGALSESTAMRRLGTTSTGPSSPSSSSTSRAWDLAGLAQRSGSTTWSHLIGAVIGSLLPGPIRPGLTFSGTHAHPMELPGSILSTNLGRPG
jgi:hypothetical protein